MSLLTLVGSDTLIIDERIMKNLADGDVVTLEVPNDLSSTKIGKNGNVLIAYNATGKQVDMKIRVPKGSSDDIYLNGRVKEYIKDPAGFSTFKAEAVKRLGDGDGNIVIEKYVLSAGAPRKGVNSKDNVEGDTEQAVSEYNITFGNTSRSFT